MIKVFELRGAQLDYWVAKSNGHTVEIDNEGRCFTPLGTFYSPSTDWSQGGPIIERERIDVNWLDVQKWNAEKHEYPDDCHQSGKTYLIAAMRCFVASKLGEEVSE